MAPSPAPTAPPIPSGTIGPHFMTGTCIGVAIGVVFVGVLLWQGVREEGLDKIKSDLHKPSSWGIIILALVTAAFLGSMLGQDIRP